MPIYISSECLGFTFISLFKFTQISFAFVELKNKSKVLCWVLPLGIFSSQGVLLRLATFLLADQLQHTAHQNKFDCFRKVSEGLEFGSLIHFYYWNTVSLSVVDVIQNHFLWGKSALAAEYIFLETSSHLLELVLPIFKVWAEFYPLASSSPNLPYTEK